ncbi:MAG: serine/threonine protein kinase [Sandaracinaceae bacterium]|nr:serine/threonine protein kinase [Sandaracinaceae bacterium]
MRICPQCGVRFEEAIQFCPNDGSPTYEVQSREEAPRDPLLGLVVDGRYRIEKQIGEGGMGVVYMATHTVLQKKLALKVLRGDGSKDAEVVQRFMQEAQAATSIGHQNIIDISDFGRLTDGSVYFVMEYLEGASLSEMISTGGSVPVRTAVHIIRQIASALEAAHSRGIVHRDLKPDNIFVIKQGGDPQFVKVLDFGVAKVGGAASRLTKTGMVFGTPHYMSPEQAAGHSVDQRTDIYALGVIMYEMFTGKVPFDADTFMGILSKHMFEAPPRPTDIKGAALGPLEAIILRSLEKNSDHRYQSMGELIVDLDTVAAGGSVAMGGRPGVAPPGGLAEALEPSAPSYAQPAAASSSGGGGKLALVAAAVLVLLLVGGGVGTAVFVLTADDEGQARAQAGDAPSTAAPPSEPVRAPDPQVEPANVQPATTPAPTTPDPVAAPAPEPPAMVMLRSEPPGAEVLLDGVMVGNTPVEVPRPASGAQLVTLRLRGHRESTVQLSPRTGDSVSLTLEPASQGGTAPGAVAAAGRRRGPPLPQPMVAPIASPIAQPPPRPVRSTRTSDVVDPWAQ